MLRTVVDAVRFEVGATRDAIHRLRRIGVCDLRVGVGPGTRLRVSGDCLCRDFLMDMLTEADSFLAGRPVGILRNPPGAVRVHVRKRVGEWTRRRRAEIGAQARTDRLRDGELGRRLPDEYHRALLEYLAEEAGSLAPFDGEEALLRRLAHLVAAEFGGSAAEHLPRVAAGVLTVEAVCRSGRRVRFGPGSPLLTWWERYIEVPLGRRSRPDELSLDAVGPSGTSPLRELVEQSTVVSDLGPAVVETVLMVVSAAGSRPLHSALRDASAELVRRELVAALTAKRFVDDPARVSAAAEQVRVLMAA
jgi:hypothetical protein